MITYQVEPALEYRTFAHAFGEPVDYWRPSIRHDGRMLAVGTDQGVMLWDLARGAELAFLPIGRTPARAVRGDRRLADAVRAVARRPALAGSARPESRRIPHRPAAPAAVAGREVPDCQWTGRAGSWPRPTLADPCLDTGRAFTVAPLDDCRYVAVSPDGQWLATGSHDTDGAQVWQISDGTPVANLKVEGLVGVAFSPDGKWLMTSPSPCKLWAVGTWEEARRISGEGLCFSPDGRLSAGTRDEQGPSPGRDRDRPHSRAARKPRPVPCAAAGAAFSPDGSQLVSVTNDGPAIHVWDLRAIRESPGRHGPRLGRAALPRGCPRIQCPAPTPCRSSSRRRPAEDSRATAGTAEMNRRSVNYLDHSHAADSGRRHPLVGPTVVVAGRRRFLRWMFSVAFEHR